jgi:hypothetical protein
MLKKQLNGIVIIMAEQEGTGKYDANGKLFI